MSNVDEIRKHPVKIVLDKERNLLFDLNAFVELEDLYGTVDDAFAKIQSGSFKAIRAAIWAGLLHEDETLTIKQVGSLITMQDLNQLGGKVGGAMSDNLPQKDNVEALQVVPNE